MESAMQRGNKFRGLILIFSAPFVYLSKSFAFLLNIVEKRSFIEASQLHHHQPTKPPKGLHQSCELRTKTLSSVTFFKIFTCSCAYLWQHFGESCNCHDATRRSTTGECIFWQSYQNRDVRRPTWTFFLSVQITRCFKDLFNIFYCNSLLS